MKVTLTQRVEALEKKLEAQERLINALVLDRAKVTRDFAITLQDISTDKLVQKVLDEFMKEVENEEL